jgi:hypothetical protein
MAIKLNATPEAYKEFYGRNVEQMPKLVAEGRVPMNASQLMQRRLDYRNGPAEVKTAWMDNYFDTGDAVVYHPNGDVKIILDSQTLREMTPESQRNGGALVLGEDVYKALQGEVFKKGKLGKTGDWMSKADVKAHPVWKVLARDQALLNDYTDFIFAEGKERFGYDTAMGVYHGSCGRDKPEMRAWCVRRLGSRSGAYGWDDLVLGSGRLVGIAPEALGAPGKGASNIKAYSMADVQTAKKQLDTLAQVVKPENLEGVKSLIAKL